MRSACPLTYSPSKARLQIPSRRGLLCLASCPRQEQPSAAGRHTKPPGTWEGLGGSSGRFLLPFPSPGTAEGERSQPGAAQGPGRGEGAGVHVPHDRMQGGEEAPRWVFVRESCSIPLC